MILVSLFMTCVLFTIEFLFKIEYLGYTNQTFIQILNHNLVKKLNFNYQKIRKLLNNKEFIVSVDKMKQDKSKTH